MVLTSAAIAGFKSFRKAVEIFFSDRTTVLIGPNDHGKTNVLLALQKLSPDEQFRLQEINYRTRGTSTITFKLLLNDTELRTISDSIAPLLEHESATRLERNTRAATASADGTTIAAGADQPISLAELATIGPLQSWWEKTAQSRELTLSRSPEKPLDLVASTLSDASRSGLLSIVQPLLPKVFLFTPSVLRQLPDTVNLSSLAENEVMQGVFHLAGIWDIREELLSGNTRQNDDELREASSRLTTEVRKNWTQGKDLEFHLEYVNDDIRLTVKDSARTVTAVGERSDGFTAYFAMRMLLVARTRQAAPNGYLFMFDEPGLNLHPKGQVDLQNVFEAIARTNQIIYTTHSVFLINKNYPTRNHLIYKNEHGTNVDNKPFVGGWAKVKEHLGLYLAANFLFADKIVLAEGPTDEIYLPAILQGLIAHQHFDGDLNALAIRGSLNAKDMFAVASTYLAEHRNVIALVDGDSEGNNRRQRIEQWAKRSKHECPVISLSDYYPAPSSIENLLDPGLFTDAVLAASSHLLDLGNISKPDDGWQAKLKALLASDDGCSLGKRAEDATKSVLGEAISKVLIAIKYAELLQTREANDPNALADYWSYEPLRRLANDLWTKLGLPIRGDLNNVPLTS